MNENEQSPQQMNSEDPSTLLPKMPKLKFFRKTIVTETLHVDGTETPPSRNSKTIFSRAVLVGGGLVILFVILAALHFSMKPKNAPTESTTETPNGGLVTITPPAGTPTAVPEIVKDKDGKEYLTGELIVAFRASVPVEEAKKLVVSAGGTIKQHFTQFPVFLVGINEAGSEGVNRAILKFRTMQEVERAEPNYLTGATTP